MSEQKAQRQTVKRLITEPRPYGLGYCCIYAFFRLFKRTGLIAARLGLTDRAIRYHKMAYKDGDMHCEKCPNCLKGRLF